MNHSHGNNYDIICSWSTYFFFFFLNQLTQWQSMSPCGATAWLTWSMSMIHQNYAVYSTRYSTYLPDPMKFVPFGTMRYSIIFVISSSSQHQIYLIFDFDTYAMVWVTPWPWSWKHVKITLIVMYHNASSICRMFSFFANPSK